MPAILDTALTGIPKKQEDVESTPSLRCSESSLLRCDRSSLRCVPFPQI
jgi:hypothetical protein